MLPPSPMSVSSGSSFSVDSRARLLFPSEDEAMELPTVSPLRSRALAIDVTPNKDEAMVLLPLSPVRPRTLAAEMASCAPPTPSDWSPLTPCPPQVADGGIGSPSTEGCALSRALMSHFGFSTLRGLQEEVINAICQPRDCVGVMATGTGKSLCYQLPVIISPNSVVVVVSPLISLMEDQVKAAVSHGVPAGRLGADMPKKVWQKTLADFIKSEVRLLYVSPEALLNSRCKDQGIWAACATVHRNGCLRFFAIDEAHCVSQWGLDFRKQYRQLGLLKQSFPGTAVLALTATATEEVVMDLVDSLHMVAPAIFRSTADRPNLFLIIRRALSKQQAQKALVAEVESLCGATPGLGIVYVPTRECADGIAMSLVAKGIVAKPYHAGLGQRERRDSSAAWASGDVSVIVATVAFGMGIDKGNVGFVFHFGMPSSITRYHQEIGRAARKLDWGVCIAWHWPGDHQRLLRAHSARGQSERGRKAAMEVIRFFTQQQCRRVGLLQVFGETVVAKCNNGDICVAGDLAGPAVSAHADERIVSRVIVSKGPKGSKKPCKSCGYATRVVNGRYGWFRKCTKCRHSANISPAGLALVKRRDVRRLNRFDSSVSDRISARALS